MTGSSEWQKVGFDVFGHSIRVKFCDDVEYSVKHEHPEVPEEKSDDCEALTFVSSTSGKTELYFAFNVEPGTIAHEAFHAVWHLCEYHGLKHDNENIAYHLGWLVRKIIEAQKDAIKGREDYARNKELQDLSIFCCLL